MQITNHDCTELTVLMSLALDDMLSPEEEAKFHAQLHACPLCQSTWAIWQQIDTRLGAAPTAHPAPGFVQRVNARIVGWERSQRRRMLVGAGLMWAASIAWMLLMASAVAGIAYLMARESGLFTWLTSNIIVLVSGADVIGRGILILWNAVLQLPWHPLALSYALIMLGLTVLWLQLVRPAVSDQQNRLKLTVGKNTQLKFQAGSE